MTAPTPSLRWRVALALIAVVVPTTLGFALVTYRARREALLESTYESVLARMESGGRERCEARGPDDRGPRGARRGRGARRALDLVTRYDASLRPADPGAPTLPPSVRAAFDGGENAVLVAGTARGGPRVALRMPWDQGPCAVVVVPAPRAIVAGGFVRDVVLALVVLLLALLAATLALGPPLRRLRQLSSAVQAADGAGPVVPASARGRDEIGVLAGALERSAERVRAQIGELEARSRALAEYVDGTTHDLALPLTVIQGHLAALGQDAARGAPASEDDVRGAAASANYLAQLAANLAAAARLEGGVTPERRPVDVGVLVQRVLARLAPIARHRQVELAAALPDAPAMLEGDELLLERALANLVHNAIRHRGTDAGNVAVIVRGAPLRVTVKSDGARIDDDALAALREGRVPPDHARTRGRGLGLSIVRKVAALHALRVDFDRGEDGALEVSLGPR